MALSLICSFCCNFFSRSIDWSSFWKWSNHQAWPTVSLFGRNTFSEFAFLNFFPFYENIKQIILLDINHSGCFVFCGQLCCPFDAVLLQLFWRARFVLEGRLFIALVWNLSEHRVQLPVLQSDGDARNLSSDRCANENSKFQIKNTKPEGYLRL